MRTSLATRAARASFAATLVLSLSLSPSFARMGGGGSFGRPALEMGHFSHFAPHAFNRRFDAGRFSFNRFGPNRFDRFGFNHFNRFGFNRFGNQLFVGGWGGWGWGGYSAPTAAPEPIIVGDGAPVIINIGVDPTAGGDGYAGGCVIHKLNYDANGKYVGERQIPLC